MRARAVALMLLLLQGLIAASPFFEPRNEADLPRIHMEQKDAPHVDLHRDDDCALCSARASFAVPPLPVSPVVEAGCETLVAASDVELIAKSDIRVGKSPRAPPVRSA